MRVVIFGGTGLLGQSLFKDLTNKKYICFRSSLKKKSDFKSNLLSKKKILKFIKKKNPEIVINCAGETDVDFCNKNFKAAFTSNVKTVQNIADSLQKLKKNIFFLHISTDQVYDSNSLSHENQINISNIYGATKYLGEIEALKYKKTLVLRTNFFGKSLVKNRPSYTDFIISNIANKKKIKIPSNVYFNPIHLDHLNNIILKLINKKLTGVFNLGSINSISKYNFAKKVAQKFKLNIKYISSFKSIFSFNQRPLNTYMSTNKLKKKINIKIPSVQDGINML